MYVYLAPASRPGFNNIQCLTLCPHPVGTFPSVLALPSAMSYLHLAFLPFVLPRLLLCPTFAIADVLMLYPAVSFLLINALPVTLNTAFYN